MNSVEAIQVLVDDLYSITCMDSGRQTRLQGRKMKKKMVGQKLRKSSGRLRRRCLARGIRILSNLIPGGKSMAVGELFVEAACYLSSLKMRVKTMQAMISMLSGDSQ
ncbi:hypothetical protein AXF42_Ash000513 [Apostasia shenzhenica]|uniref:Transcription factor UPBEAT1 n=1 Tax=Apostasia shenzhenica TaxID=1088818 RepID=A0A2I0AGL8_9ASPA|nr:hypothetical protein AXF42_Ash000513 [Apostasia shenzhenica]